MTIRHLKHVMLNPTCEWSSVFKLCTDGWLAKEALEEIVSYFEKLPSEEKEFIYSSDEHLHLRHKNRLFYFAAREDIVFMHYNSRVAYRETLKDIDDIILVLASLRKAIEQPLEEPLKIIYGSTVRAKGKSAVVVRDNPNVWRRDLLKAIQEVR